MNFNLLAVIFKKGKNCKVILMIFLFNLIYLKHAINIRSIIEIFAFFLHAKSSKTTVYFYNHNISQLELAIPRAQKP